MQVVKIVYDYWILTSYNEVGVANHQTKKIVPMIFVFEPET